VNKSALEHALALHIRASGLPTPTRQFRFAAEHVGPGRGVRARLKEAGLQDWKADFAWLDQRVLCEVQGGLYTKGRHVRPAGYEDDCRKADDAQELGWRVVAVTRKMISSGEAVRRLERALGQEKQGTSDD